MMGRKYREQANFFYEFPLDDMIPKGALDSLAAQRGFELLNPEMRPATGKGLTANSGAIGA